MEVLGVFNNSLLISRQIATGHRITIGALKQNGKEVQYLAIWYPNEYLIHIFW